MSSIWHPRQDRFYTLFDEAAANVRRGAELLVEMLANYSEVRNKAREIKAVEHVGDELTHDTYALLNRTFVTPLDREDIARLASSLDDILDLVEASADDFVVTGVSEPTASAMEMAQIIAQAAVKVQEAVRLLPDRRSHSKIRELVTEINTLENEGDRVYRTAMEELYKAQDPIYIIKWKQIYDHLERAIDRCEDVADELQGILLKYA
jgi:predicted phosphate transport protein (TIGR00153 family)